MPIPTTAPPFAVSEGQPPGTYPPARVPEPPTGGGFVCVDSTTSPRAVELWIPAAIVLIVGLRWLLGERHSVYGDEAFHLMNLWNGLVGAQGGLFDRLVRFYLFNFAYPPVFYLLSAPFILHSADPVFAGRVYAQVLTLLVALVLYTITRLIGGRFAGAVAVATLLGTPSFVDVSRHYLLEPLLTLEVLLVLYFIGCYYQRPRLRYLTLIAGLTSAGLLTKFNFVFYAAPLFVVPVGIEFYRLASGRQRWSAVARSAGVIVVAPLVLAGPWYLARATGPMSAPGMLGTLYQAGTLKPGVTPELFAELTVVPLSWNYSGLSLTLALIAVLLYTGHVLRLRVLGPLLRPMTLAQHVGVSSAFVGAVTVPLVLALTGLGGVLRWHVETAYLLAITFGVLGRLEWLAPRLVGLVVAAVAAVLQLVTICFMPLGAPAFLRVPDPGLTPVPSAIAVGSEALARDIARHEKQLGGTRPGDFAYFLFHEHRGPHFGSVELYLRLEGAPLIGRVAAFYNRALDVENIFGAKYLIEAVAGPATHRRDPETERYRRLAENLPPAFRSLLIEVSDVEGRFGHFKAYYVPRDRITSGMVLSTIEIGRRLETVEPNLILWDAQRVIWRAKFETVPGSASLRSEIDSLLARIPAAEPQLLTINRQALHDYLVRIRRIRGIVG